MLASGLIEVVPGLMIWTLIAFGITFFVLRQFAFGPIQKTIDDRRDRIRQAVEEADNARNEARELLEQNRAILAQARSESARHPRRGPQGRGRADRAREAGGRGRAAAPARGHAQADRRGDRPRDRADPLRGRRPHDRGDGARRRQGARRRGPEAPRARGRRGPRLLRAGERTRELRMAVAHRMYARALYEAAREHGRVDVVRDELSELADGDGGRRPSSRRSSRTRSSTRAPRRASSTR